MLNGLPVFSVVLVCSIAFFGCVAEQIFIIPETVPEAWDECTDLLQEVETVRSACFGRRAVDDYLMRADKFLSRLDGLVHTRIY